MSAGASPTTETVGPALFAAPTREALLEDLRRGRTRAMGGPARAVVFEPSPARLERACAIVERGKPWRGRDGVWFSPEGLLAVGGSLAFVFPGVDATFEPRVHDVAARFDLPLPECTRPRDLTEHGIGIVGVNRLLDGVLRGVGFTPAHVAGHSVGEWSGMIATGMIPGAAVDAFVAGLGPGSIEVPGVVFAAAGCGVEVATTALRGLQSVALTHDNCPHQVLFCGAEASVEASIARLRAEGVLCQKLPFQSGFHSPLFEPYLAPHRENFRALPLLPARLPMWSATTCGRYPDGAEAVRALSVEHLVRAVRFRELVARLHDEGVRAFVQVGTGSLVNFIEDTLRGRPHLAISANVKERGGLEQLRRVAAALFVEGAHAARELLEEGSPAAPSLAVAPSPISPAPPRASEHPILADLDELFAAVKVAGQDVAAALDRAGVALSPRAPGPREQGPREQVTTRRLSLETMPELRDHSFVRQPPGWPVTSDWQPVVPMTTSLELMMEHALALAPGRVAARLEDVRAYRWLMVAPPVDLAVTARFDGVDRVHVRLGDYAEGTVVLAAAYPPAPAEDQTPLAESEPAAMDARRVYDERHLFHGPAYQGIVELATVGADGIRGTVETGPARGALLDSAGQLYGYWVMSRCDVDRMAMPMHVESVDLYGPHPRPGERLECLVRVRSFDERSVVADVSLSRAGRVWARLAGWQDRRFETDQRLWDVMLWPERHCLAQLQPEGFVIFHDGYRAAPTRDRLARRFLGENERAQFAQQGPRSQRGWLAGRIAAKDAVRHLLWQAGHGPLFPVEIAVDNEPSGRPVATAPGGGDLRISLAHKDGIAVALARQGQDVGIDVERVEERADSFAALTFTVEELRLVEGEPRAEAWTRLWCAKEAAAKAAGTGLGGAPSRFPVRDRAGTRLLVGERWVDTKRHGDFVVGWTTATGASARAAPATEGAS